MTAYAHDFVAIASQQAGDAYVWGAETSPSDPDPDAFDCSELVQWALFRIGLPWVDGSWIQEAACRNAGLATNVPEAIRTPGALLFLGSPVHHVAISRGDGSTIEARGRRWGTNIFSAVGRFSRAGLIPGLHYGPKPSQAPPVRQLSEEETMPRFIVDPDEPAAVGRTGGWRLVKQLRCVLAVNGAPLAKRAHDDSGRAIVVIPAKYGEIIDMDLNSDRTGLVVLMADDGTIDIPFRKAVSL